MKLFVIFPILFFFMTFSMAARMLPTQQNEYTVLAPQADEGLLRIHLELKHLKVAEFT